MGTKQEKMVAYYNQCVEWAKTIGLKRDVQLSTSVVGEKLQSINLSFFKRNEKGGLIYVNGEVQGKHYFFYEWRDEENEQTFKKLQAYVHRYFSK